MRQDVTDEGDVKSKSYHFTDEEAEALKVQVLS